MFFVKVFLTVCACAVFSQAEFFSGEAYFPSSTPAPEHPDEPPAPSISNQEKRKRRSTCTAPAFTDSQKAEIVNTHNQKRSMEGATAMMELEWDDDLAGPAQDLANRCVFEHNLLYSCSGGEVGQNVGARVGAINIAADMSDWYSEKNNYNYDNRTCSKSPCGHYTQMVWASTRKIGCGFNLCPVLTPLGWEDASLFVCNYSPVGNWYGQFPFKKGIACSECKSAWPSAKDPFTATSQDLCGGTNTVSDETCKYPCVNGNRDSTTCECHCSSGYCGVSCDTEFRCVNGIVTGNYGCGCQCNEGSCGTACDKTLTTSAIGNDVSPSGHCTYWKECGYCEHTYVAFMKDNCINTCGFEVQSKQTCV